MSLIFLETLFALLLLYLGPPFSPQFSASCPEFFQQFELTLLQVSHVVQVSHTETMRVRIIGHLCWPLVEQSSMVHFEELWVCVPKNGWDVSNYSRCEKGENFTQGPGFLIKCCV